jgi:hypothetical protein
MVRMHEVYGSLHRRSERQERHQYRRATGDQCRRRAASHQ